MYALANSLIVRTMTRLLCTTAIALAALLLNLAPAAAQSASPVVGTWQTIVPATITSYQPSASDPTTGTYQGMGSTLWQGTWSGVTYYAIQGTANLVNGAGSGTLRETFVGRSSSGRTGTITFAETYVLDSGGHAEIRARVVDATGQFTGDHGSVTFVGTMLGVVTGSGIYRGTWVEPTS